MPCRSEAAEMAEGQGERWCCAGGPWSRAGLSPRGLRCSLRASGGSAEGVRGPAGRSCGGWADPAGWDTWGHSSHQVGRRRIAEGSDFPVSAAQASGSFRGGHGMFRSRAQKTQGLLTVGDSGCCPALFKPVLLSSPSLHLFFPSFT